MSTEEEQHLRQCLVNLVATMRSAFQERNVDPIIEILGRGIPCLDKLLDVMLRIRNGKIPQWYVELNKFDQRTKMSMLSRALTAQICSLDENACRRMDKALNDQSYDEHLKSALSYILLIRRSPREIVMKLEREIWAEYVGKEGYSEMVERLRLTNMKPLEYEYLLEWRLSVKECLEQLGFDRIVALIPRHLRKQLWWLHEKLELHLLRVVYDIIKAGTFERLIDMDEFYWDLEHTDGRGRLPKRISVMIKEMDIITATKMVNLSRRLDRRVQHLLDIFDQIYVASRRTIEELEAEIWDKVPIKRAILLTKRNPNRAPNNEPARNRRRVFRDEKDVHIWMAEEAEKRKRQREMEKIREIKQEPLDTPVFPIPETPAEPFREDVPPIRAGEETAPVEEVDEQAPAMLSISVKQEAVSREPSPVHSAPPPPHQHNASLPIAAVRADEQEEVVVNQVPAVPAVHPTTALERTAALLDLCPAFIQKVFELTKATGAPAEARAERQQSVPMDIDESEEEQTIRGDHPDDPLRPLSSDAGRNMEASPSSSISNDLYLCSVSLTRTPPTSGLASIPWTDQPSTSGLNHAGMSSYHTHYVQAGLADPDIDMSVLTRLERVERPRNRPRSPRSSRRRSRSRSKSPYRKQRRSRSRSRRRSTSPSRDRRERERSRDRRDRHRSISPWADVHLRRGGRDQRSISPWADTSLRRGGSAQRAAVHSRSPSNGGRDKFRDSHRQPRIQRSKFLQWKDREELIQLLEADHRSAHPCVFCSSSDHTALRCEVVKTNDQRRTVLKNKKCYHCLGPYIQSKCRHRKHWIWCPCGDHSSHPSMCTHL